MDYLRKSSKSVNWVYRRRVPSDVAEQFGRAWVEQSLKTSDAREAKKRALILSGRLEETWDALRGAGTPLSQWQRDVTWLSEQKPFTVTCSPHEADPEGLRDVVATGVLEDLKAGTVKPPPGVSAEAYAAWVTGDPVLPKPKVTLREAFKAWLDERKPSTHVARGAKRVVEQFQAMNGDVTVDTVTRAHARKYRDSLLAAGNQPGSVSTYVSYLRAIYETALKEELVEDRTNPFRGLRIDRTKGEEEEREPIPADICRKILTEVLSEGYDQHDWFAAVLLTTGMSPGEAAKAKLVLDAPVPHWDVPRFKTSTPRKIPLHPLLHGKTAVKFTVRPEQLRRQFIERFKPFVGYQCRHSWNDEARRVGMPLEMRLRLFGHSVKKVIGVNSRYGASQVGLVEALPWVEKMWA